MSNACKLCGSSSPLQQSHAIPDSIFRRLFQANSGKAILLDTEKRDIEYTSDSLDTPQLCRKCEDLINNLYERYSLEILRNRWGLATRTQSGITFSGIDANRLCMFFIAIFWRAANSSHRSYGGAVMPIEFYRNNINEFLINAIRENTPVPGSIISIKIQRLVDLSGGFDMVTLKNLIVTPFPRPYGPQRKVSVCFVIEGFLITLIMPGLNFKARKNETLINRKSSIVVAKFVDIFSDITLNEILLNAYHKAITAQSKNPNS